MLVLYDKSHAGYGAQPSHEVSAMLKQIRKMKSLLFLHRSDSGRLMSQDEAEALKRYVIAAKDCMSNSKKYTAPVDAVNKLMMAGDIMTDATANSFKQLSQCETFTMQGLSPDAIDIFYPEYLVLIKAHDEVACRSVWQTLLNSSEL